ncbi:hypothetical protein BB8028_0005g08800 [Beauveria bassiana]|uniref:Uncharacterized protein n=1 Tax=Beauveria bassiana TaxID=176275 RepID=A0A2S7YGT3_BEABA|nr:hypothetical protein BB8028_0005g08800 [Beauveria bassiana]
MINDATNVLMTLSFPTQPLLIVRLDRIILSSSKLSLGDAGQLRFIANWVRKKKDLRISITEAKSSCTNFTLQACPEKKNKKKNTYDDGIDSRKFDGTGAGELAVALGVEDALAKSFDSAASGAGGGGALGADGEGPGAGDDGEDGDGTHVDGCKGTVNLISETRELLNELVVRGSRRERR